MRFFYPAFSLLVASILLTGAETIDGINAIVDDSVITFAEVENLLADTRAILRAQYPNQPQVALEKLREARSEYMEELVKRKLILHDFERTAKEHSFKLPETLIDDVVKEKIKRVYGDRATATRTLQEQGKSFETFRQDEKETFLIQSWTFQKVSSEKIVISPHKIETYYQAHQNDFKLEDQVKLRIIVLNKTAASDPAAVRKMADEILVKIDAGTSFAEMASVYSESAQRTQGGDRGWVDRTYFKKELSDVAFGLKAGEHSKVIDLPEACYILLVEETRPAHVRPLAEVKEEIERSLKAGEKARLEKQWINRLRAKSFVRYY